LLQAEADGVAIHGFKGEDFQKQQIERALNEIQRFAHGLSSVTESTIHKLPSVSKGKMSHWRVPQLFAKQLSGSVLPIGSSRLDATYLNC
jgi:hypothetical protein